jgi:hypothetical protein
MVSEYQPSLQKLRMPSESCENMVHAAIPLRAFEDLSCFAVPLRMGKRRDAWLLQPHSCSPFTNQFTLHHASAHGVLGGQVDENGLSGRILQRGSSFPTAAAQQLVEEGSGISPASSGMFSLTKNGCADDT